MTDFYPYYSARRTAISPIRRRAEDRRALPAAINDGQPSSLKRDTPARPHPGTTAILKGWKSLSPGLRGTPAAPKPTYARQGSQRAQGEGRSYPGVKHRTSTTLKGLHQLPTAAASEPFSRIASILLAW